MFLLLLVCITGIPTDGEAQKDLSLPDPLILQDGDRVTTPKEWVNERRPELLEQFRTHVYGRSPVGRPADLQFDVSETDMDGHMKRKSIDISFSGPGGQGKIDLLLFLPHSATGPIPVFLLICHRSRKNMDPSREHREDFWPAERITQRGFAAAAFHGSDVDPDTHD